MKLAGDDQIDVQIVGMMNLLRSQIKGALARLGAGQIDLQIDIGALQASHQPLRTAQPDLRLRNVLRVDLQVLGNIPKLNGHFDRHDRGVVLRHGQPQPDGEGERDELQAEVVQHVAAKEILHV